MSTTDQPGQIASPRQSALPDAAVELAPDHWAPGGRPDPLSGRRGGHVGRPLSRLDGPAKVQGRATFAAEFEMADLAYAALAFSTIARGRIATLDTSDAEAASGVILVMTHRNAPRMQAMPLFYTAAKAAGGDALAVMQDDRIAWNGQPIALVLADTQEQADHATSLIGVTYAPEPAATTFAAGRARGTEPARSGGEPIRVQIGDAEAALAAAPIKVDSTYTTPRHNHNAIEPHAATVAWHGDELMVHDASQWVDATAWSLGQVFGIDERQVHVTSPFVGGGFGAKILWQHQVLGAAAAKLAGRPVRITLSREGVYRVTGGRTLTEQRVAIGAQADGGFDAIIHTGTSAIARPNMTAELVISQTMNAYAAGSFILDQEIAYMDVVANTFTRAPGKAVGSFALESAVDELAVALDMDPIELRIRNEPETDPTAGRPFSSRHVVETWRMGADRFGWAGRHPTPGATRDGEWLIGIGCACANYPYVRVPGGAARMTLTREGRAHVEIAAHEMGMGTATAQTQVIADRLGLELEQVSFTYGDSRLPGSVIAGGSQQTASIGAAVIAAHNALVAELLTLVADDSPLAGLAPAEVGGAGGGLVKLDDPGRYESYTSILGRAHRSEVTAEQDASPPDELAHWSMNSYGALFCEVRVNTVTRETRVSRFLGAFDCGRILNAKTAASQLRGGIIMGLGVALMEETQVDGRNGRIMNPSLAEYHVPVHLDVPEIEVMWTDIPDPHTPMGARGVGEIGITGVAAAVANAIYHATGRRVRDLPLTLDKLL